MADFIKTQNSFSNGEVSPEFFACDNINGLSKLENMDVLSSGALSRRQGLSQITQLRGPARLISFSVANGEEYIISTYPVAVQWWDIILVIAMVFALSVLSAWIPARKIKN